MFLPGFIPRKSKVLLALDIFMATYLCAEMFTVILCLMLALLQPRRFIYIGQLVPEKYFYFPIAILVTYFHIYVIIATAGGAATVGCGVLVYCFYVAMLSAELRLDRRKYECEDTLRILRNTMHVYRYLQTFHANVICLYGPYLVVFNAAFMMSTVYVNFALMRYWHELESLTKMVLLLFNFILVTFYLIVLELGSIFSVGGMKMLKSWKRVKWSQCDTENKNKEMGAFRRSCRPILLCWGNHFVIGRQSIIVYGRGVFRGTLRALLATK